MRSGRIQNPFGKLDDRGVSCDVNETTRSAVVFAAFTAGVVLIVLAVLYWVEPAKSLPAIMPGHAAGSGHHHVKHGVAAFLLGLALLAFAWFKSAPTASKPADA